MVDLPGGETGGMGCVYCELTGGLGCTGIPWLVGDVLGGNAAIGREPGGGEIGRTGTGGIDDVGGLETGIIDRLGGGANGLLCGA